MRQACPIMDFRALLQNQWFQLCLLVALLSGGASVFNLAKPGPLPPAPPGPTPLPRPSPQPAPTTSFSKLKPKTAGRWIVDASGAGDADSRTLAMVIANVSDGDIVTVRPGDYFEGIVLTKNVRLVGQPSGNTAPTLHAQGVNTVEINAKNVGLENLRLEQDTPGDRKTLRVAGGSQVELVNCQLRSKSTFCATVTDNATLTARDCLFQSVNGGSALQFENDAHGNLTRCTFSQSRWGLAAAQRAQVEAADCTFQNLGLPTGGGATLAVEGGKAEINARRCRFTGNTAGILAKESASLALYDCVVSNSGVTGETGNTSIGCISAQAGARVVVKGGSFENNKQGIIARNGCTMRLERVQIRGCGLVTENGSLLFDCNSVAAFGQGCTLQITGSSIADSINYSVVVTGGAQVNMIESTISNAGADGLVIGSSTDGGSKATLNNVKVLGARDSCIWVNSGSEIEMQTCQLSGAVKFGLCVEGENSRAQVANSIVSSNRDIGLGAYSGATLTATGCTLEGNARGAQAGVGSGGASGEQSPWKTARSAATRFSASVPAGIRC